MMEAVRTSETSVDNHFTRQYNPEDSSEHHSGLNHTAYTDIALYSYVVCTYSEKWWTGVVMEKSDDNSDCLVKFTYPEGPSPSFHWSQKGDISCVEI
jgi:hypothetical protein